MLTRAALSKAHLFSTWYMPIKSFFLISFSLVVVETHHPPEASILLNRPAQPGLLSLCLGS